MFYGKNFLVCCTFLTLYKDICPEEREMIVYT